MALLLLLPPLKWSSEIPPKRFSGSCSCGWVPAVPRGLRGSGATPGSTPAAVGAGHQLGMRLQAGQHDMSQAAKTTTGRAVA